MSWFINLLGLEGEAEGAGGGVGRGEVHGGIRVGGGDGTADDSEGEARALRAVCEAVEALEGAGDVEDFEAGEEEDAVGEGRGRWGGHGGGRRLGMSDLGCVWKTEA